MLGRLQGDSLELEIVRRFANDPVELPGGLHWNMLQLFSQSVIGLRRAASIAPLDGIGVDSWGVDYALLDEAKRVLALPYHYRDGRTAGMVEDVHARVPRSELYARTGIQTMPINTVFQLAAERGGAAARGAQHIAMIGDLIGLWLTGELRNEVTNASTSGLLDARSGTWARDLIERIGLPMAPFEGPLYEPGERLGPVLEVHRGVAGVPVFTVASHDTASAFVAAPVESRNAAILSSGTWSLLGLEINEPLLDGLAAGFNLTNERGIDGTIRLLRNVMGLWLLQECRRRWELDGRELDYDAMGRLAATHALEEVALFDPDEDSLLAPGDMPGRIAGLCNSGDQSVPIEPGQFVSSILVSLACKYRFVLDRLRLVTERTVDVIHVIGGGSRNEPLCQLIADVCATPVLAGPVEATAMGNVLVQARAAGALDTLKEMRALAGNSTQMIRYEPSAQLAAAAATYERFLARTGLVVEVPEAVLA